MSPDPFCSPLSPSLSLFIGCCMIYLSPSVSMHMCPALPLIFIDHHQHDCPRNLTMWMDIGYIVTGLLLFYSGVTFSRVLVNTVYIHWSSSHTPNVYSDRIPAIFAFPVGLFSLLFGLLRFALSYRARQEDDSQQPLTDFRMDPDDHSHLHAGRRSPSRS